jgi:hypothetical protein
VTLKRAVLNFLERRNYAVVHANVLEKEREAAARNLARLQSLEARMIPAETPGRRPKLEVPPVAPPPEANDLKAYASIFDDITPWSGIVPEGFEVDFMGTRSATKFLAAWGANPDVVGGEYLTKERPRLGGGKNGEFWFEAADWVLAVREARGRFVMITLGALYGYQAVGSQRALQLLNPLPYTLVAVEPDPENMEWVRTHMRDNGIDPDKQWLVQAAISDTNQPAFFPIGSPGSGAPNCIASNEEYARKDYLQHFVAQGRTEEALENILLHNSTGLQKDVIEGKSFFAEIKLVSTITLQDVLGPFERVDLLESDIQESEIVVFPPFRDLLKRKVHRIHIGTHGKDTHRYLLKMFHDDGWRIVFAYEPESTHDTIFGPVMTNDGVLSLLNPSV